MHSLRLSNFFKFTPTVSTRNKLFKTILECLMNKVVTNKIFDNQILKWYYNDS